MVNAWRCLERGWTDRAAQMAADLLVDAPHNVDAHLILGIIHQSGRRWAQARHHLLTATRHGAEQGRTHAALGHLMAARGQLQQAVQVLERALNLDPRQTGARFNLGTALLTLDRPEAAISAFQLVLEQEPNSPAALGNLGNALARVGREDAAVTAYRRALELSPNDRVARFNLGNLFLRRGAFPQALRQFQLVQKGHGPSAELWNNIGTALQAMGQSEIAARTFRAAIAMDAGNIDALSNLASCMASRGARDAPVELYQRVLARAPEHNSTRIKLGRHLISLKRLTQAEPLFTAALSSARSAGHPEQEHDALAGLAEILRKRGEADAARTLLESSLPEGAGSVNLVVQLAALARKDPDVGPCLQYIRSLLDTPLPVLQRGILFHALGTLEEARGDLPSALAAYSRYNELLPGRFDDDALATQISAIKGYFSALRIPRIPRSTRRSERPVLIVGMPRTGSSLLEQMLDCHPQIHGAGELTDLRRLADAAPVETRDPDTLDRLADDYLAVLTAGASQAARCIDKMPSNFLVLGFVAQLFPNARVIHLQRDPLDVAVSCFVQRFGPTNSFSRSWDGIVAYTRAHRQLMGHWRRVLPLRVFDISYEELIEDPEDGIRRVLGFLDLPWDDACLHPEDNPRVVHTASNAAVRERIHRRALGRGQRFASLLGDLPARLAVTDE